MALLTLQALLTRYNTYRYARESHPNHGGVEPCSGHLDTCCKVSFLTTEPSSLKSRLPAKSAESRRLRGDMIEVSMAPGRSFFLPLSTHTRQGEKQAEHESLGKSGTKECLHMHLCHWPDCPNFACAAGILFALGGSCCLHAYPSL